MRHRSTSRWLLGCVAYGMLGVGLLGAGTADAARPHGWVWADQPTRTSYTPHTLYQHNQSGGTNTVERRGVGDYAVLFPGASVSGGNVQVTAYGAGDEACKVGSWGPSAGRMRVLVRCFTAAGVPVDTRFVAFFYHEDGTVSPNVAYLWANKPTQASYVPSAGYQYNPHRLRNRVERLSEGHYKAILPGFSRVGGTVLVTAYGTTPERCKVERWSVVEGGQHIFVRCHGADGRAADTRFALSYSINDVPGDHPYGANIGAYLWSGSATAAVAEPSATYRYNAWRGVSVHEAPEVRRTSRGRYDVLVRGMPGRTDLSMVLVTAYGSGAEHCKVVGWYEDGDDTRARVLCLDAAGRAADSRFTLTYLTNDLYLH